MTTAGGCGDQLELARQVDAATPRMVDQLGEGGEGTVDVTAELDRVMGCPIG